MAACRSGVTRGGREGDNNATGLLRFVIRISSPRSTRESNSENSRLARCALTFFIVDLENGILQSRRRVSELHNAANSSAQ
jgi:hypothetical protein